jgi:hypothetical protein
VGFEPTVSFPTLDFESSALNRTQPPFLEERRKPKIERPTSNPPSQAAKARPASNTTVSEIRRSALEVGRWAFVLSPSARPAPMRPAERILCLTKQKNVTIKGLPPLTSLLHLVCPHGQPRYYLLLTGIHRFLAPLFTSILSLFETSTPPIPP